MAVGQATPDARAFELTAQRGDTTYGICSNPFLEKFFRTDKWTIKVKIHDAKRWSYRQETTLIIEGNKEPFLHIDESVLEKIAEPNPNPLAEHK
jgi:hypothetical protein